MKLDPLRLAFGSYRAIFRRLPAFLRLTAIWYGLALLLAIGAFLAAKVIHPALVEHIARFTRAVLVLLFAARWHRLLDGVPPVGRLDLSRRDGRYLWQCLALLSPFLLLGIAQIVALLAFGRPLASATGWSSYAILAFVLLAIAIDLRLALILPPIAAGARPSWRDIFRASRGNSLRLYAGVLLVVTPLYLVLFFLADLLLARLRSGATAQGLLLLAAIAIDILRFASIALIAGFFSLAWQKLNQTATPAPMV